MPLHHVLPALTLFCLLSFPAFAGFEEGKSAYDRKDWRTAIAELRPLAENGDDRAMVIIANMYSEGLGVIQNGKEAMSLYKRAATQKNNTDAMVAIASLYINGGGVAKNFRTAQEWYLHAAELGDPLGAFFYATLTLRGNRKAGDDVKPDFYNACKWFLISAKYQKHQKLKRTAEEFARNISRQKLTPEQAAAAAREAGNWAPKPAKVLNSFPSDPEESGKP